MLFVKIVKPLHMTDVRTAKSGEDKQARDKLGLKLLNYTHLLGRYITSYQINNY